MNENLLQPVDDGLAMRPNKKHSKDKLNALDGYIHRFITSMHKKPWRALFYIDLMAGPGKNRFSDGYLLGSPLISLNSKYAFTHYRFVESNSTNYESLRERVNASERKNLVRILQGNCNDLVDNIVSEISIIDSRFIEGKWPSLNLAFLDPEGLELKWETVQKLGKMNRMDLIINFSTNGITRNAQKFLDSGKTDSIDLFFGTDEWQEVYRAAAGDSTRVRRALLDLYKKRLGTLGYQVVEPDPTDELVFKSSKNVQLYTLLGASKDKLGEKFWRDTIAKRGSSGQLSMF